ncbi:O-antigen ligase family protein [Pseudoalteromonas distincta]|uniref:O-antigen ligase-related domain-containing protein n=1 Tax=Pseudoalteromonas distincta TaxID=77608 RepID=A0A4P9IZY7_9GAMM|nr:O-antigen ligase family protein [Pseudoalteromonas distincta]QCU73926.1 hypothetical protein FFU37_05400 [Pseudoalteromonas distincta]
MIKFNEISIVSAALFGCVFFMLLSMLDFMLDGLRYVKYVVPVYIIIVFSVLKKKKFYVTDTPVLPFLTLVLIMLIFLIINPSSYGIKDIYFIFSYVILFVLFDIPSNEKNTDLIFKMLVFYLLLKIFSQGVKNVSILDSEGLFEDTSAFIFGFFSVYYFILKKKWMFLISLIMVFITFKRIVILGVCLSCFSYIFSLRYCSVLVNRIILIVGPILTLILLILFSNGNFDWLIDEYFGVSSNQLAMGRVVIYSYVIDEIIANNWLLLFGYGIGSSYQLVDIATLGRDQNLHSDILKLYYEGGLFLFLMFLYSFSKCFSRKVLFPMAILLLISFSTDNILIYSHVMFFFVYLSLMLKKRSEHEL